ncbi:hypothetical protein K1719_010711 [Acacia pycnantha]|nr:hypothetical protein K1719_010711 [Acacia pycnantha]
MMVISVESDLKKPIEDYLERGLIPDDAMEAKMLVREAAKYTMVEDQLYRKGLHSPMLRCLNPNEAGYVLAEPSFIPSQPLGHFTNGAWTFGAIQDKTGQLRWLIVAVDYFTKWIEAEPLTTISSARVQRFVEVNIITRFGAPAEIVTDNGTQFTGVGFRDLIYEYGIQHHFASVEHPQSNGQAEAANKVILEGLKKRMLEADTSWADQLPFVLWGNRTTAQTSTQETPYRLAYGCESMIPVEIGMMSWRRKSILSQGETANNEALAVEMHLADEARVTAHCRDIAMKQLIAARYNKKVRPRTFQPGCLVLRRADIGNKNSKDGKPS